MASLVDSVTSLISSILTGIMSIFTGILALVQHALGLVWGIFSSLVAAAGTAVAGLAQTFEGLIKFLLSNIVIIGVVVGAFFLYTVFVRPGAARSSTKKVN